MTGSGSAFFKRCHEREDAKASRRGSSTAGPRVTRVGRRLGVMRAKPPPSWAGKATGALSAASPAAAAARRCPATSRAPSTRRILTQAHAGPDARLDRRHRHQRQDDHRAAASAGCSRARATASSPTGPAPTSSSASPPRRSKRAGRTASCSADWGVFEIDEASLPEGGRGDPAQSHDRAEPVPRPARPLRRAGVDRQEDRGALDAAARGQRTPSSTPTTRASPRSASDLARTAAVVRPRRHHGGERRAAARRRRADLPAMRREPHLRRRLRRPRRRVPLPQRRLRAPAAGDHRDQHQARRIRQPRR